MSSTASGTTPCCPSPAPPRTRSRDPEPAAPRGPDLHALADPAITGMSRAGFGALAARLEIPLAAAREQRLYTSRGGPRRPGNHRARARLTPRARLLAAICRYRLGMTCRAIAALLGIDPSAISIATRQIAAIPGTASRPRTRPRPVPHPRRPARTRRPPRHHLHRPATSSRHPR